MAPRLGVVMSTLVDVVTQNRSRAAVIVGLGWLLGAPSGCGHPSQVHPVTGVVFLNRMPVEDAEVVFLPAASVDSKPARGKTDAHGHFDLNTYFGPGNDVAGAMAGQYAVTIRKVGGASGPEHFSRPEDMATPKNELPGRYADPKTSGLSARVRAEGENNFEFHLAGRPPD
jgi:hypothetical protein